MRKFIVYVTEFILYAALFITTVLITSRITGGDWRTIVSPFLVVPTIMGIRFILIDRLIEEVK